MARTRDMTTGSPTRHILLFCLPIIAGNAFQQLYSLVDTFIIGNAESVTEMTAVSSAGWLDWTVLSIAIGLTQGFGIQIAQSFGAGDYTQMRKAAGQSLLLSLATIVVLEVASQLLLWPVLRLMDTPDEIIHLTCLYLRIIFGGMALVMGFNLFSGFLRAVGDSTTPLIAMTTAACINIVLDILFVAVFRWSVAGVAVATVISQGASCLICLNAVLRTPVLHLSREDVKPDAALCAKLMKLGMPIAFQNTVISIGGLVLQTVVNGFSFVFVCGFSATSRLTGLIELAGSSLGSAVGTFTGQNLGARRLDRVKLGLRRSAQIGVGMALVVALVMTLFGQPLLGLFINDEDPQVVAGALKYAYEYLLMMSAGLPMLYLLFAYRSTLQGVGDTFIPMLSGFMELAMRIGCVLLLPALIGVWGVYVAEIMAWSGAAILLMWGYYRRIRLLQKDGIYQA
ncbi:MAG: MATE family efflux transporter [Clostridia bacterium]|nr:MATE family efflux transporter [Clostridia bacterium]